MSTNLVKVRVLQATWLVPVDLVTAAFKSAVTHLNELGEFRAVTWTDEEREAFDNVCLDPMVWKL